MAAPTVEPMLTGAEQAELEITRGPLDKALPGIDFEQAPEAFARLCYADQALTIDVTKPLREPLRIHHSGSTMPIIIRVAANSALTLLEDASASKAMQQSIWIDLGKNAQLKHSRNALRPCDNHWQYLNVRLQQGANYQINNHVSGSKLRRQDIHLVLMAKAVWRSWCRPGEFVTTTSSISKLPSSTSRAAAVSKPFTTLLPTAASARSTAAFTFTRARQAQTPSYPTRILAWAPTPPSTRSQNSRSTPTMSVVPMAPR